MSLRLDQVRALAERVAASHGLEVVDVEFAGGGGKHRTLRVFLEKDEAGRKRLREALERLEAEDEAGDEDGEDSAAATEWGREWLEALPSVPNLEYLSGITHEDCEAFSRDYGTVLDVEDLVPGTEYLLEVSSPGLDRRLSTERDFRRFAGSLVKLETREPLEASGEPKGRKKWQGRIDGVEDGRVLLLLEEGKAGKAKHGKGKKAQSPAPSPPETSIPLGAIEKAHLIPEF
jgi:ribosome maturation factor RimP